MVIDPGRTNAYGRVISRVRFFQMVHRRMFFINVVSREILPGRVIVVRNTLTAQIVDPGVKTR
jgi:hypothetical protein